MKKNNKFQIFNSELNTIINPKDYFSIQRYKHESINGFYIFKTIIKSGVQVIIGENGVEFFKD